MIYLSKMCGAVYRYRDRGLGVMLTPWKTGRIDLASVVWAADNGCFSQPEAFRLDHYLAWLAERRQYASTCLFAVAPDVVGDAAATWKRSAPVLPLLRELGYKAAYVAQDGIERERIAWSAFDCLFIGGSTGFKVSPLAWSLVREAHERGKWSHVGRVNSLPRLRAAYRAGAHSCDGSHIAFKGDRGVREVLNWLDQLNGQPELMPV